MKRHAFAAAATAFVAVIFIGLNLAAHRFLAPVRIDFTQDHLYTLSPGARAVTQRLVEPVELELVYSREVAANFPAVRAHGERVRELLHEIAARSNGKVRIRETDPEPFSDDEDRITAAGITAQETGGADPLYFGVLGKNSVDDVIAIPHLAPERDALLEYDLIRLVAQLDDPEPKKIAILSSLPALNGVAGPKGEAFVIREMRRAFTVEYIDPAFRELPKNADVLLIAHPPPLDEWQSYLIDQFLLHKGRALIAVDPVSRIAIAARERPLPPASGLGPLEASLGVKMGPEAVADRALGLPVTVDAGEGRRATENQPLFIGAPAAAMPKGDPVTADLTRSIIFGVAGGLKHDAKPGLTFTPLIETTDAANQLPFDLAALNPPPRDVIAAMTAGGARQVLAARVSGKLATAFPNGAPQVRLPDDTILADMARRVIAAAPPPIKASEVDAQVILVSDADLFDDGFYINPQNGVSVADNAIFILNALDNLVGDPTLMALRSRAPALRPMEKVDQMRAKATERLYDEQAKLKAQLDVTEARLKALETQRTAGAGAEAAEIGRLRAEAGAIRTRQRAVEREFRRDIDGLQNQLKLFSVWLPPLTIAGVGIVLALLRNRQRGRAA